MKNKLFYKSAVLIALCFFVLNAQTLQATQISENPTLWQKISLQFEGPSITETSTPNPFTDFRLDVEFTSPSGKIFNVPGYFAADGDASESSADSGNVWQINFIANEIGTWQYKAFFVAGNNIAAELSGGETAGFFDGETGSFNVAANNTTTEKDFSGKGKLEYVGEHFLQFQGSKEYFLKSGVNSPEVYLEYAEFDNTPSDRTYPDFINDWKDTDPSWQNGKGKGIIGTVNYLSSIDMNSYYFLTMNAYGDGKKAWPWINQDSLVRYDCSKLEQWDILFQHMNKMGVMVHFVLTETENEALFEIEENGEAGGFAKSRKIYFREMVARYGYLPALTWNVGEENGWAEGNNYHIANTDQQRKDFCDYIRDLSYYNDHIAIHNGPSDDDYIFDELIGHESFTGPAFQWDFGVDIFDVLYKWRSRSAESGHKWVMSLDEPYVNPPTRDLNEWRTDNVWPTYMAGCAGIELYIGQGYDLTVQDFRTYEPWYLTMSVAANFLKNYTPFYLLEPDTAFSNQLHTLRLADSVFVLYMFDAKETIINLPNNNYKVEWFNPRSGGAPIFGTKNYITGGADINIGQPLLDTENDWVCLLTKINDNQGQLDLSKPQIQKTIEEGNAASITSDTIIISTLGDQTTDSVWVELSNNWLSHTIKKIDDKNWQCIIQLNTNAEKLKIGLHQTTLSIFANNCPSIYANYNLDIIYNLNGNMFFYTGNGIAVIEIESAEKLPNWELATEQEGYSGEGYYYYNGDFMPEPADTNIYAYYFYIAESGTYRVGIHNYIPSTDFTENNDTWLKIDDDRWWKHFSHTNLEWNWETQLDDGHENFYEPSWDLKKGFHVLKIGGRSTNFYLDKIHIYNTSPKEQVVLDKDLKQSAQCERNTPILSLNKAHYVYNFNEGDIPNISNKTITITNAGSGTLENISAETASDKLSTEITGTGNTQKLIIDLNEKIQELEPGLHTISIALNCTNAPSREVKFYFNIQESTTIKTGSKMNSIYLKSTLVKNHLQFISYNELKAAVQLVNTNGQTVFNKTFSDISNQKIDISTLSSGIYIARILSEDGIENQKFFKQ